LAFLARWKIFGRFFQLEQHVGGTVGSWHAKELEDIGVLFHVHVYVHENNLLPVVRCHAPQLRKVVQTYFNDNLCFLRIMISFGQLNIVIKKRFSQ
jgi:hypothetical protein